MTRLDNYISHFCSWTKQTLDKTSDKLESLDMMIVLINGQIEIENPQPAKVRDACIATYDYCEIKNDWYFWEKWASREGVLDSDTSGIIYAGLGRAAEEKGELDLSLIQHERGCELLKKNQISSSKALGLNHHGLGIVFMRQGDIRSFEHFYEARQNYRKQRTHYHLGCAYCDTGGAYYWKLYYLIQSANEKNVSPYNFQYIKDVVNSLTFYSRALAIHREHGYYWDLARIYYSLGFTTLQVFPLILFAKFDFIEAIKWGKRTKTQRYIALSHYGLGLYYYYLRNFSLARIEFVTAHNMYTKLIVETNQPYYLENEFNISSMLCQTYLKLNEMELFNRQFDAIWTTFINERNHNNEIAEKRGTLLHIAKKAKLQKQIEFLMDNSEIT